MKKIMNYFAAGMLCILFLTSCDDDNPVVTNPTEYDNASVTRGGMMYDKFWSAEAGYDQNNSNISTLNSKSDFFRCKQCHGWDGLGSKGAYINRGPKVTRPNVDDLNLYEYAKSHTAQEIFDEIKSTSDRRDILYDLSAYDPATNSSEGDKMPKYGQLLTDAQIWDLVKFLKEGMFDVSQLYDATITGNYPSGTFTISNVGKDGNETNGIAFYTANCAICHGTNGTDITIENKTAGAFTRSKANEVQHKVKYGQLGSSMIGQFNMTVTEMKDLYKALANKTNFPD